MPINSTRGAGSAKGFGLTAGGSVPVDFRGNASTTLNAALATGESVTVALITKQANTTFFNTSVLTVDGTSTGVTVVYQGGSAPTTGNASSNDVYTYTAIKTAASTYTILACLLYTSPSPRDRQKSRMPSSA